MNVKTFKAKKKKGREQGRKEMKRIDFVFSHSVVQAGLELMVSLLLHFPDGGITGLSHHTRHKLLFFKGLLFSKMVKKCTFM